MDERVTDVAADELVARLRSRKDFLKLLSAAGLGVAAGANVLPGAAEGAVRTQLQPTDFRFKIREHFRPFNLLAKNFVELDDSFDTDTTGNYTVLRPGGPSEDDGVVEAGGGTVRFSGQSDYYTILKSNTGEDAPYVTVIVNVASLPDANGNRVYAGLYKDEANYVHAYYDSGTNTVGLEAAINGTVYDLGSTQTDDPSLFDPPFRFAFVANENEVTALVGDPSSDIGDFRPIIKRDVKTDKNGAPTGLDLRDVTVLETYKNGFGARSGDGSTIAFGRVQAGYYGEAGVRDPHCIQYADGTPYIKNNKLYFTLTNAGLGFFEKAHWAVWTMDLSNYRKIEQVGNIFWHNAGDPTKVLGHHAGQIVLDQENSRWIVLVSSWGDFGPQGGDQALTPGVVTPNPPNPPVDILYDEQPSTTNLLEGVHILEGKRHPVNDVPFPTEGKWDPGLTRIDGTWYLSYVIALDLFTDFQPALAKSAVDHDTALEFVGADWAKGATEGPVIQKLGGEWRLLASSGDDEAKYGHPEWVGKYPMYFLEAENPGADPADRQLKFDGYLHAPHPTNIPHPMVVPLSIRSGGRKRTKYIMLTFNGDQYYIDLLGYGTHGDFYVMQAKQTVRGWVFPRRSA